MLRTAEREEGVKRVVFTTTCGTVSSYNRDKDYVFTENDWNDDTSLTNKPAQYVSLLLHPILIQKYIINFKK